MWIRIKDIPNEPESIELLARAFREMAIAQSLVIIHGQERGMKRYAEIGTVKLDDDGEPCIWRDP